MISSTPGLAAILFSRELHVRNAELRAGMAKNQKAVVMKDRRTPRGGAKNEMREDLRETE